MMGHMQEHASESSSLVRMKGWYAPEWYAPESSYIILSSNVGNQRTEKCPLSCKTACNKHQNSSRFRRKRKKSCPPQYASNCRTPQSAPTCGICFAKPHRSHGCHHPKNVFGNKCSGSCNQRVWIYACTTPFFLETFGM